MNYYVSIFKNSKILGVTRYGEEGPGPKGTVMTAAFELNGQEFTALNGGWLKDQYGLSWQVIPTVLVELLQDKDPEKVKRVIKAMLQIIKLI